MQINTLTGQLANNNRNTGRTTSIALRAISNAINNPNQKITVRDHYGTRQANDHLRRVIKDMIHTLGLKDIIVGTQTNDKDAVTLYFELWEQIPELFVSADVIDSCTHVHLNGELYCKVPTGNGK